MISKILALKSIIVFGVAALLPAGALLAEDVKVDVVVDMTDAGKMAPHPTPDKPAYFFPLTVGYKEEGAYVPDQKLPPPTEEIQHLLGQALYEQGYRIASSQSAPAIALVFWWGYMAPEILDTRMGPPQTNTHSAGINSLEDPAGFMNMVRFQLPTSAFTNQVQMMSLVAGNTRDFQYPTDKPGPLLEQIMAMSRTPRYYLMVSALDFQDWLHHKVTLLWRAHVSTELWGHDLADVLPAMITAGAPLFGHETTAPQLMSAPIGPQGLVIVGAAEVKK